MKNCKRTTVFIVCIMVTMLIGSDLTAFAASDLADQPSQNSAEKAISKAGAGENAEELTPDALAMMSVSIKRISRTKIEVIVYGRSTRASLKSKISLQKKGSDKKYHTVKKGVSRKSVKAVAIMHRAPYKIKKKKKYRVKATISDGTQKHTMYKYI